MSDENGTSIYDACLQVVRDELAFCDAHDRFEHERAAWAARRAACVSIRLAIERLQSAPPRPASDPAPGVDAEDPGDGTIVIDRQGPRGKAEATSNDGRERAE